MGSCMFSKSGVKVNHCGVIDQPDSSLSCRAPNCLKPSRRSPRGVAT